MRVGARDRVLDYLVEDRHQVQAVAGALVRVPLGPRLVDGYVVGVTCGFDPALAGRLRPIRRVSAPPISEEMLTLTRWAAWRWAAPWSLFLAQVEGRAAFAGKAEPTCSQELEGTTGSGGRALTADWPGLDRVEDDPLLAGLAPGRPRVVRVPPGEDQLTWARPLIELAVRPSSLATEQHRLGRALVLVPQTWQADLVRDRLRRAGLVVAGAGDFDVMVGCRQAALAECPDLGAVVVLDAHDSLYLGRRWPECDYRVIAAQRARLVSARIAFLTPAPTPELARLGPVVGPSRSRERAGWPTVEIISRKGPEEPVGTVSRRLGRLAEQATPDRLLVCVGSGPGEARSLRCRSCRSRVACPSCRRSLVVATGGPTISRRPTRPRNQFDRLWCPRCRVDYPPVCPACSGIQLSVVRPGADRLARDLTALLGRRGESVVMSWTRQITPPEVPATCSVVVGSRSVLSDMADLRQRVATVALVDLDHLLLSSLLRATTDLMGLVVTAAALVGPRAGGGHLLLQTEHPDHPLFQSVVKAAPELWLSREMSERRDLGLPPYRAVALATSLDSDTQRDLTGAGVVVLGPDPAGRYLIEAPRHRQLIRALNAIGIGRLPSLDIDPLGI